MRLPQQSHSTRTLRWLLYANVAATVAHYLDNILFFGEYPEPPWMKPHFDEPAGSRPLPVRADRQYRFRIHLFIAIEAALALALVAYVAALQIRDRRPRLENP